MVLVSHDFQFIYLKSRKVAGTSVEMALEPFCAPLGHVVDNATPAIRSPRGIVGARGQAGPPNRPLIDRLLGRRAWAQHMNAEFVRNQLPAKVWANYSKLSVVRNPFDRMVSYFYWMFKRGQRGADFRELKAKFRDFVMSDGWSSDKEVTHVGDTFVVDHMLRYEQLTADLDEMRKTLNLPVEELVLPSVMIKWKQRRGVSIADHFDTDTTDEVRRRMAWAFERFDYSESPADADILRSQTHVEAVQ